MTLDASTALALAGTLAGLVWLIIRLSLRPLEQRMDRWEAKLGQVKDEVDLGNMIDVRIARHERSCGKGRGPHAAATAGHVLGCVAAVLLLAWALAGCAVNPMVPPAEAFMATVGTEYLEYIEADPDLDEPARRARRANVEAFRMLIQEGGK